MSLMMRLKSCKLSLYCSPNWTRPETIEVERAGIQIYLSDDYFASELRGTLYLLENPLRKILGGCKYKNIVSVRIEE